MLGFGLPQPLGPHEIPCRSMNAVAPRTFCVRTVNDGCVVRRGSIHGLRRSFVEPHGFPTVGQLIALDARGMGLNRCEKPRRTIDAPLGEVATRDLAWSPDYGCDVPIPYVTRLHAEFASPDTLPSPKNSAGPVVNVAI